MGVLSSIAFIPLEQYGSCHVTLLGSADRSDDIRLENGIHGAWTREALRRPKVQWRAINASRKTPKPLLLLSVSKMAAAKPVMHDEEFYFQDIIIQVENRLFKVPRRVFIQESQVFRDMFSLPVPEGILADGASDSKPLELDGIMAIDFVRLLRFLFPTKQLYPLKTLDEWTSVFKLAALWDMEDVKAEAIQKMTPLLEKQPAKQVKLSLEHGVEEWLVPGLNRLVQRAEPLNKDDVDFIGLDYALQIMTLREDCRHNSGSWSIQRRGEVPLDFAKEIQVRFNIRQ